MEARGIPTALKSPKHDVMKDSLYFTLLLTLKSWGNEGLTQIPTDGGNTRAWLTYLQLGPQLQTGVTFGTGAQLAEVGADGKP